MADHRETVTARIGTNRYATDIRTRDHHLVADEPTELGGTDGGPTPYELLSGALGACTVITLRMYADRKGWPMEEAVVQVTHEKVHAEDCDCETEATGRIDLLTRQIELVGPLSGEQRARLMEIADRCPVHRTLKGTIAIKSALVESV